MTFLRCWFIKKKNIIFFVPCLSSAEASVLTVSFCAEKKKKNLSVFETYMLIQDRDDNIKMHLIVVKQSHLGDEEHL